jgi:hypothetical protein
LIRDPHSIRDFRSATFPEIVLALRSRNFHPTDAQLFDVTVRYAQLLAEAEERVPPQWSAAARRLAA